jgi:hypothetical protein
MTCRVLTFLALAVSAVSVLGAPDADPLKSEACRVALAAMDQVLAAPPAAQRPVRIAAARNQAAVACLGRSDGRATRSGAPNPVQAMPQPATARSPTSPSLPPSAVAPPAVVIPRPTVITTCDPAGCWDSEGRRLDNMGPLLMSPRGPCTVQGGLANCP